VRVDRLVESIELYRALFSGEPVSFRGTHYEVDDFVSFPTPVQSPVPLMIGGGGKRMLQMARKPTSSSSKIGDTADRRAPLEEQLGWIAGGWKRPRPRGRHPRALHVAAAGGRADVAERVAGFEMTPDDVLESPFASSAATTAIRRPRARGARALRDLVLHRERTWRGRSPVVEELSR
jgi:hypothetical protein